MKTYTEDEVKVMLNCFATYLILEYSDRVNGDLDKAQKNAVIETEQFLNKVVIEKN